MKEGGMEHVQKEPLPKAAKDNENQIDAETRAQWQRESTHEAMLDRNKQTMWENRAKTNIVEDKQKGLVGMHVDRPQLQQEQAALEGESEEAESEPEAPGQPSAQGENVSEVDSETKELEEVRTRLGMSENTPMNSESDDLSTLKTLLEQSSTYGEQKGVAVMNYIFRNLYPNPEVRSNRLAEIVENYQKALEDSKSARPDLDPEAHQTFAMNSVLNGLPAHERSAMESFLDEHYKLLGGGGQRLITAMVPFRDFIKSLS